MCDFQQFFRVSNEKLINNLIYVMQYLVSFSKNLLAALSIEYVLYSVHNALNKHTHTHTFIRIQFISISYIYKYEHHVIE